MIHKLLLGALLLACGQGLVAGALTTEQIAEIREETQQRRLEFFVKESGKPLVRAPIKKDWNNRGDFTRHYAQSIVLFAMRACELNEQLDEANAALQELCQYHLDRPETFFEVHSFPVPAMHWRASTFFMDRAARRCRIDSQRKPVRY